MKSLDLYRTTFKPDPDTLIRKKFSIIIVKLFGRFINTCGSKKIVRNATGPWRGENRGFQFYSQRLNQVFYEPSNEIEETNGHQRLN